MIELMKKAVEALKTKIALNLEEIRSNETYFRMVVSDGKMVDKSYDLNLIVTKNKTLLAENFELINVQISILKFMEKYQHKFITLSGDEDNIESQEPSPTDYFQLTVNGDLEFSINHPMFNNDDFFYKIMEHYKANELYEKCSELIKIRTLYNLN